MTILISDKTVDSAKKIYQTLREILHKDKKSQSTQKTKNTNAIYRSAKFVKQKLTTDKFTVIVVDFNLPSVNNRQNN